MIIFKSGVYCIRIERDLDTCGAYGVILEKWNPEVDAGWEHVDSCWGFENWDIHPETGYIIDPNYDNNYVVQEFKEVIAWFRNLKK